MSSPSCPSDRARFHHSHGLKIHSEPTRVCNDDKAQRLEHASHLILSHLMSSRLISSYLISSHFHLWYIHDRHWVGCNRCIPPTSDGRFGLRSFWVAPGCPNWSSKPHRITDNSPNATSAARRVMQRGKSPGIGTSTNSPLPGLSSRSLPASWLSFFASKVHQKASKKLSVLVYRKKMQDLTTVSGFILSIHKKNTCCFRRVNCAKNHPCPKQWFLPSGSSPLTLVMR